MICKNTALEKKLFKFNLNFDFNNLLKAIICPLQSVCEYNIKDYAIKQSAISYSAFETFFGTQMKFSRMLFFAI